MTTPQLTKTISTLIALSFFVVALISGLAVENSGVTILTRSIIALVVGQAVGLIVASAARVTIAEYLQQYRDAHPVDETHMNELEARLNSPR